MSWHCAKDKGMNLEADQPNQDNELLKLRLEYLHKRLDHTLQHSQTATKLIYLVDGAVLGFCYFFIKELDKGPTAIIISAFSVLVLAILNYFHAGLIGNQQSWYAGIDTELRALLGLKEIQHSINPPPLCPASSHKIWQRIHFILFGSLLITAFIMFLWWGSAILFPRVVETQSQKRNDTQITEPVSSGNKQGWAALVK